MITLFFLIGLEGPGVITFLFPRSAVSSHAAIGLCQSTEVLQSRFPPAHGMEDDARSSAGSVNSWINVDQVEQPDPWAADVPDEDGLELPPADLRFNKAPLDPIPEQVAPPPPLASTAAPVTQAARNLVDNVNEPPASRRLRRQQELAQKKGKKGARFVNWVLTMPAISPCQPTYSKWALDKENVLSWCWITVINGCNPLFRGGFWMRS